MSDIRIVLIIISIIRINTDERDITGVLQEKKKKTYQEVCQLYDISTYVVHLLVWIVNCTRWAVHMLKFVNQMNFAFSRLRLKCDGTRAETRFRLSHETDESI